MVRRVKEKRVDRKTENEIKRVLCILKIPYSPETRRGLETEQYVIQALEYYQKKKTEFPGGRRIIEVIPTAHYSAADQSGIDAFIKFQTGPQSDIEILSVQIRDWWEKGAERKFKRRGICLIRISLFNRKLFNRKEKKTADQIKKEARERSLSAIFYFYEIC